MCKKMQFFFCKNVQIAIFQRKTPSQKKFARSCDSESQQFDHRRAVITVCISLPVVLGRLEENIRAMVFRRR